MPVISGLKTNAVTIGTSVTDTQNFQLRSNADGTATLARKSDGSGGDVLTIDSSGKVAYPSGIDLISVAGSDYIEGSFVLTSSQFTSPQAISMYYVKTGKSVVITSNVNGFSGTKDGTTGMTLTGLPSTLYPVIDMSVKISARDNGGALVSSIMVISTTGAITVYSNDNGVGFTAGSNCKITIQTTGYVCAT
jgi:hypothetical protein